ncbi:hypothetical protein [Kitasatospora brasiliensis]|uniref:hypothetical protein n=1 Tax=Kitasatospora brasiliensis TaxID=3058040 RepID=UPI002931670F|nr:hypothetical protein [Kitasatospora sp. K002]
MGAVAFFAGLLLFVMGLGKWQETGSDLWLYGSLGFLLVLVVVSLIPTGGGAGKAGKGAKKG